MGSMIRSASLAEFLVLLAIPLASAALAIAALIVWMRLP